MDRNISVKRSTDTLLEGLKKCGEGFSRDNDYALRDRSRDVTDIKIIQNATWTAVYKNNQLYKFSGRIHTFENEAQYKYKEYLRESGVQSLPRMSGIRDFIDLVCSEGWMKIFREEALDRVGKDVCSWTCYNQYFKEQDYIDKFNLKHYVFNCDIMKYDPPMYFSELRGFLKTDYNLEEQYGFLKPEQKAKEIERFYDFIG